jgi:hypothetical protein
MEQRRLREIRKPPDSNSKSGYNGGTLQRKNPVLFFIMNLVIIVQNHLKGLRTANFLFQ